MIFDQSLPVSWPEKQSRNWLSRVPSACYRPLRECSFKTKNKARSLISKSTFRDRQHLLHLQLKLAVLTLWNSSSPEGGNVPIKFRRLPYYYALLLSCLLPILDLLSKTPEQAWALYYIISHLKPTFAAYDCGVGSGRWGVNYRNSRDGYGGCSSDHVNYDALAAAIPSTSECWHALLPEPFTFIQWV